MTAVLRDEAVAIPPGPPPTASSEAEPTAERVTKRQPRSPIGAGSDPLANAASHLLAVPLRQVYAVLWRMGLIEVKA
jgi:hypothetical protein